MDLDDHPTDAAAVAELARLADGNLPAQVIKTDDGRTLKIHRNDVTITDITPTNAAEVYAPKIIALTTQLQTSLALCQYLHRFKDDDSILFADVMNSKITCILDYHVRPNDGEKQSDAVPRHSAHRAVLQLRHSQEWQTWVSRNEKLMSHTDFAGFLEENGMDIIVPDGAALLELCRDLQIKGGMTFKSSIRMGDTMNIEYQKDSDVSTKDNLELPAAITIKIPVYFGEEPITLGVLLRRKIDDGQLFLGFKIMRLENAKQAEFLRIAHEISADTDVESVLGNPA